MTPNSTSLFFILLYLLHIGAMTAGVIYILRHHREPRAMLAWILTFILLPEVGWVIFFFIGDPKLNRVRRRRHRQRQRLSALSGRLETLRETYTPFSDSEVPAYLLPFVGIATRAGKQPPTRGNLVTIYHDGKQTFQALLEAMRGAKSHIHLQYYILHDDATGRRAWDLLVEKAREGVECRVLVDYIGSWRLSREYIRGLKTAGVKFAFFLPVVPWRWRWRVNLRNHRKIAVIDGKIGFTGSQNIGDEYLGLDKSYAQWRDTHLRVIGPAVLELQEVFVEDWHYASREDISDDDYFPEPECHGNQIVQVIPSGPDADAYIMHHLLLGMIAVAREQISIATPYFVPDSAMVLSLQAAAYRGVKVELLIPTQTDQKLVLWAARSYYPELCGTGVEIFEYPGGMLHSKVAIIDSAWALVGSANMDERSFRLNFEISTLLYDVRLARQLHADFAALRAHARPWCQNKPEWGFGESLLLGLARLASPIL